MKHIYSASKQVSGALNPDSNEGSKAFQECVLARHPRHGEFAIAFITGRTVLQVRLQGGLHFWVWHQQHVGSFAPGLGSNRMLAALVRFSGMDPMLVATM